MILLGIIDCRPDDDSLVAVLSTESLLLNVYRQRFWENPIFLAADASCRLTPEGNGRVFPVITTNLAQRTRAIAYGVTSHEHHKAQKFIFSTIKSSLEELVSRYYRKTNKIPI